MVLALCQILTPNPTSGSKLFNTMQINVAQSKYVTRAKRLRYDSVPDEEHPHPLESMEFRAALLRAWDGDAHFVCHEVPGEQVQYAMTKGMLGLLRKAGGEILINMLAVDLDKIPDHDHWTGPEQLDEAIGSLVESLTHQPLLVPSVFYGTLGGFRMIYLLSQPVPADEAEPLYRGLHALLKPLMPQGLKVDEACSNWDRCFRMPDVYREGKGRTPDYLLQSVAIDERQTLDPSMVPKVGPKASSAPGGVGEVLDIPMPLLEALPKITKAVKVRLKNRECEPFCFGDANQKMKLVPQHGKRDTLMIRLAGQIISLIRNIPGTTPATVFALLHSWASCIPPEEAQKPPLENLWDKILRIWSQDEAREAAAIEKADDPAVAQGIVELAREKWAGAAGMPEDPQEAEDWLRRISILSMGAKEFFLLQPDGFYSRMGVPRSGIIPELKHLNIGDSFIPMTKVQGKAVVPRTAEDLINEHSFNVERIVCISAAKGCFLTKNRDVILPTCRLRTDLEPKWDQEVDEWLRAFWGDKFGEGCNWMAYALDIESGLPICAAAMIGPPGAGKKLLSQGIAECFDSYPYSMASSSAFGQFAPELKEASFITVDEGIPHTVRSGQKHPSEIFRSLVAGDPTLVDIKFKAKILIKNPMRIIFTANNHDIINVLCAGRDMTEDDRVALAQRLIFLPVQKEAAELLRAKGGRRYTDRWIHGDGSLGNSTHKIACHLLHIHKNFRRKPPGARLLVEGTLDSEVMMRLRTETGSSQVIVPVLIRIIENKNIWTKYHDRGQIFEEGGRIYITTSCVFQELDDPRETLNSITHALRSFSAGDPIRRKFGKSATSQRWRILDLNLLLFQAEDLGYPHERIAFHLSQQKTGGQW